MKSKIEKIIEQAQGSDLMLNLAYEGEMNEKNSIEKVANNFYFQLRDENSKNSLVKDFRMKQIIIPTANYGAQIAGTLGLFFSGAYATNHSVEKSLVLTGVALGTACLPIIPIAYGVYKIHKDRKRALLNVRK